MKLIVVSWMVVYLVTVFLSAVYHFFKTKTMTWWQIVLILCIEALLSFTLVSYCMVYQPHHMLLFAIGFTSISGLFLFQKMEQAHLKVLVFNVLRFFLHVQLLILLYLFR